MRRLQLAACLLIAGPVFAQGGKPSITDIRNATGELAHLRLYRDMKTGMAPVEIPDVRGRREIDDILEFVLTDATDRRIESLLEEAGARSGRTARSSLADAQRLLRAANASSEAIMRYWERKPAIYWRHRWKIFAEANGLSPEAPDPQLAVTEGEMLGHLKAGDFARAAGESARMLDAQLKVAIDKATAMLAKTRDPATLDIVPNTRPCTDVTTHAGQGTRITRTGSPEDYYPPGSIRRGEEGAVVLRAFVDSSGCPTGVALVVRSGYPGLDAAALQVYEATLFAAGTENGEPVAGDVTFKVRFHFKP